METKPYAVEFTNQQAMSDILAALNLTNYTECEDDNTIDIDLNALQLHIIKNDRRVVYVSEL